MRDSLIVWAAFIAATAFLIAVVGCDNTHTPGQPIIPAPVIVHEPEITELDQVKRYFQVDEARPDKPVVAVMLSNSQATDVALKHLKDLPAIEVLGLNNTKITDAGLVNLKNLTSLKQLYLNHNQISDAGLEHLKGLTKLWSLNLSNTQVTDAGLGCLSEMTELRFLNLTGTNVTELGKKGLQQLLPKCKTSPGQMPRLIRPRE